MSFVLGLLGFGKVILTWVVELGKKLIDFVFNKPWIALSIVLAGLLVLSSCNHNETKAQLAKTEQTVSSQKAYINTQAGVLTSYVDSLAKEKKTLADTIKINNAAVADIQNTANKALAGAQEAGKKAESKAAQYQTLADKYGQANLSVGTAEERITREQDTTDSFIREWKNAK
jgi:hypothetical protein